MALTLPLVLPLVRSLKTGHFLYPKKRLAAEAFPFAIALAVYGALRIAALGAVAASQTVANSGVDWLTLGLTVAARYIRYALIPFPLHAYHLVPLHLQDRMAQATISVCDPEPCWIPELAIAQTASGLADGGRCLPAHPGSSFLLQRHQRGLFCRTVSLHPHARAGSCVGNRSRTNAVATTETGWHGWLSRYLRL